MSNLTLILLTCAAVSPAFAQKPVVVRPKEIDGVLVNPGMGFMTFQRFNGDTLNSGTSWTEGFPVEYQPFKGTLDNGNHPATSIAYIRVYWRYVEPEQGKYAWELFDKALATAHARGQTLMVRIAPYGSTAGPREVPDWYRTMVGEEADLPYKWRTNAEDPRYVKHFGGMIRAFGKRYDGHPDLESVDMALVGAWGEGAGSQDLSQKTREALVDAYLDGFRKTPLVMMLTDAKTNGYGISKRAVGWRVDCLGDMGGFSDPTRSHMQDIYPERIANDGMRDAWQKAPVSFEACWVMQHWLDKGWDVNYIIEQSLKWHISSFNGKSSAVPEQWRPQVDRWLTKMGYRLVLRKFTYPPTVRPQAKLDFTTWWENKGVAPPYREFPFALRLKGAGRTVVLTTDADIRTWLPGDVLYDNAVFVPADMPAGDYDLAVALVDPQTREPRIKLAIEGREADGWYTLGKIRVQ